jgi:hypothetical protein
VRVPHRFLGPDGVQPPGPPGLAHRHLAPGRHGERFFPTMVRGTEKPVALSSSGVAAYASDPSHPVRPCPHKRLCELFTKSLPPSPLQVRHPLLVGLSAPGLVTLVRWLVLRRRPRDHLSRPVAAAMVLLAWMGGWVGGWGGGS